MFKLYERNQEYVDLEKFEENLKVKSKYENDYKKFGYIDNPENPKNESFNAFHKKLEFYKKIKLNAEDI